MKIKDSRRKAVHPRSLARLGETLQITDTAISSLFPPLFLRHHDSFVYFREEGPFDSSKNSLHDMMGDLEETLHRSDGYVYVVVGPIAPKK